MRISCLVVTFCFLSRKLNALNFLIDLFLTILVSYEAYKLLCFSFYLQEMSSLRYPRLKIKQRQKQHLLFIEVFLEIQGNSVVKRSN